MYMMGCRRAIYWAFLINSFLPPNLAPKTKKINALTPQKNPENSLDMAGGFF
jgi:hypothetical protein